MSLQHFWVEVVTLCHVEVRNDVFSLFVGEHVVVEGDLVKVLVVFLVLKVVHDGHLGRIVLQ